MKNEQTSRDQSSLPTRLEHQQSTQSILRASAKLNQTKPNQTKLNAPEACDELTQHNNTRTHTSPRKRKHTHTSPRAMRRTHVRAYIINTTHMQWFYINFQTFWLSLVTAKDLQPREASIAIAAASLRSDRESREGGLRLPRRCTRRGPP